jgi:malonyl-CoA/methylmalonyl-CoA synthetase
MHDLLTTLARNATRSGPLVVDAEGGVDAATLLARIDRAASHLLGSARDLRGRRVAVLAPSGASFLVALFGAFRAGAAVVVLSPLHPVAETRYFCDHARVDTIVFDPSLESLAAPLAHDDHGKPRRMLTVASLTLASTAPPIDLPPPRLDDDALVLYTSGTTAKPKGARITHGNLAVQAELLRAAWRWSPDDRLVHALPLHHLHGLGIALFTALSAGAAVEMHARFDAHRVWESIAVPRAGLEPCEPVLMTVPTMLMRLLSTFDEADASTQRRWTAGARTLRLVTSGSAALASTIAARWASIAGEPPLERFGMTEIGVGTANRIDGPRTPGVAGFPLETVEIRIVDEAGRDVEDGVEGELLVRGPSLFPGYDDDERATRAAFTDGDPARGFFRTGDSVVMERGVGMRVRGRLSVDVLKSGGYKISALEIEEVLRAHADVRDVAVVGMPDPEWGDLVTAVVVMREGANLDEASLRSFARERLAPYKVPKRVVFLDALPRNVVGKVVKPSLVASLAAALAR